MAIVAKIESEEPTLRLAVLIDTDNAQAVVIEGLFAEIARFGKQLSGAYMEISLPQRVLLGRRCCSDTQSNRFSNLRTRPEKMPRTVR